MLIEKIRSHNYINGLRFSAIEFALATLLIGPFCIYYISHGRFLYAAVASGLILNFLTITFFALVSLAHHEKSIGLSFYLDPENRRRVRAEYPHLSTDTLILCIAIVVPFSLFLGALLESAYKMIVVR